MTKCDVQSSPNRDPPICTAARLTRWMICLRIVQQIAQQVRFSVSIFPSECMYDPLIAASIPRPQRLPTTSQEPNKLLASEAQPKARDQLVRGNYVDDQTSTSSSALVSNASGSSTAIPKSRTLPQSKRSVPNTEKLGHPSNVSPSGTFQLFVVRETRLDL